jgi:hypothetical protein
MREAVIQKMKEKGIVAVREIKDFSRAEDGVKIAQ